MKKPYPPIYYSDYLQLNKLLDAQLPKSREYGNEAHDEMLFITVHQAYELWFKQILHEVDSIAKMFKERTVDERSIGIAVSRLQRIIEIQKLLTEQLRVLETMTPLDFLEFRDYLIPASGFQSFQFRLIENKLGLKNENRLVYNNQDYFNTLEESHQKIILESMENHSLFDLIEKWLERTPFIKTEGFDFWECYRKTIGNVLNNEKEIILNNKTLSEEKLKVQLENLKRTTEHYEALFSEEKHRELVEKGFKRLSAKATLAALFINLYRDEPILHLPFMFLTSLTEMDELFTVWRYRHALMVQRMIGTKVGTGGSSGHSYLMATVDKHRVFMDLFNLSTYLIPRSSLPVLPDDLIKQLGFYYSHRNK